MGHWSVFIIKDQELALEETNIYFVTRLSRRGERVQLFGSRLGGESASNLVKIHCRGFDMTTSGKVKIAIVTNLPLRMILFTIARIFGTQALHEASQSQFWYVVECLTPKVFNWCGGLLDNMKRQLTKGKWGNLKQFGFGSILVTFFLEWVPLFWNQCAEVLDPAP